MHISTACTRKKRKRVYEVEVAGATQRHYLPKTSLQTFAAFTVAAAAERGALLPPPSRTPLFTRPLLLLLLLLLLLPLFILLLPSFPVESEGAGAAAVEEDLVDAAGGTFNGATGLLESLQSLQSTGQ